MATRVRTVALFCVALLTGCGSNSAPTKSEQAEASKPQTKPIDGYGDVKFGQSFNEVMAAYGQRFDAYYIRSCYKDLAINGCSLATTGDVPFQMIEGIPYRLTVQFNKFDKVTDVQLQYAREGSAINSDDCRSIHERTLDWLTRDYGKFYSPNYDPIARQFRTPAGNAYSSGVPNKEGSWVALFARTYTGVPSPDVLKKPLPKWDNRRYVQLFTTYIVAAGNHCNVYAEFSEPGSVPRQDLMRATTLDDEDSSSTGSQSESTSTDESVVENDSYDENDAGE